jgi:malonyl-CoA O-methyltransferase
MTPAQRGARLVTTLAVASPRLWAVLRAPFRRYFDCLAPRWDRIADPRDLGAIAAALGDVPPPRRALDVGTGTGNAAFLVAERFPGAEVTGVDLSAEMIAIARAKGSRVRFETADAAALPFEGGSFDLVTLSNAIPFFDEVARVLAPDGTLLVGFTEGPATPIWVPPDRLRTGLSRRGLTHFREYRAGDATCLLARRRAA